MTGIDSWDPMPTVHRLRAGAQLALPLKAGQTFAVTEHTSPLGSSARVRDWWQSHADGDVLELHVVRDPGLVRGLSDNDPRAEEDPQPYLNRDQSAPNGHLVGRERLMAGDRLSWFSDTRHVVFEIQDSCQVFYRTWNPQIDPKTGSPLPLNIVTQPPSRAADASLHDVLALDLPRTWAPRNPDPAEDGAPVGTCESGPEDWLHQLHRPK